MTRPVTFRQCDVERALKACQAAGLSVAGVEVNDNGFIVLVGDTVKPKRNPLDRLHAA